MDPGAQQQGCRSWPMTARAKVFAAANSPTYHVGSGIVLWHFGNAWPARQPPPSDPHGDPHGKPRAPGTATTSRWFTSSAPVDHRSLRWQAVQPDYDS